MPSAKSNVRRSSSCTPTSGDASHCDLEKRKRDVFFQGFAADVAEKDVAEHKSSEYCILAGSGLIVYGQNFLFCPTAK